MLLPSISCVTCLGCVLHCTVTSASNLSASIAYYFSLVEKHNPKKRPKRINIQLTVRLTLVRQGPIATSASPSTYQQLLVLFYCGRRVRALRYLAVSWGARRHHQTREQSVCSHCKGPRTLFIGALLLGNATPWLLQLYSVLPSVFRAQYFVQDIQWTHKSKWHFFSFRVRPAPCSNLNTSSTCVYCCCGDLKKMMISSLFTIAKYHSTDEHLTSPAFCNVLIGVLQLEWHSRVERQSITCNKCSVVDVLVVHSNFCRKHFHLAYWVDAFIHSRIG